MDTVVPMQIEEKSIIPQSSKYVLNWPVCLASKLTNFPEQFLGKLKYNRHISFHHKKLFHKMSELNQSFQKKKVYSKRFIREVDIRLFIFSLKLLFRPENRFSTSQ